MAKTPLQNPLGLTADFIDIYIRDDRQPLVDLILDLLKIPPNTLSSPLIAVCDPPAALDQPLASLSPDLVESSEYGLKISLVHDGFIAQQFRQYGAVLDAESGTGTVVR